MQYFTQVFGLAEAGTFHRNTLELKCMYQLCNEVKTFEKYVPRYYFQGRHETQYHFLKRCPNNESVKCQFQS